MKDVLSDKVIARYDEKRSTLPNRSLDLRNINTPELAILSPNRNEIAPTGPAREAALIAYAERLRHSYKQNDQGLRDGMVMLGEAFRNGQSISITCPCRAGQMCHADVIKIAIEKVAKALDSRDRFQRHDQPIASRPGFVPSNPRTERAISEIVAISKSDLELSRLNDTDGRNRSEHASYLNTRSQFLRDTYERGGTVIDNVLVIPKERAETKAALHVTTHEYGVKRLEPILGPERSRDIVPQIIEYGKAIAGSGADREMEAKVFRWIYDALEGKREFLQSPPGEKKDEPEIGRFDRTLAEISKVAEEMERLEPVDDLIQHDSIDAHPVRDDTVEGLDEVIDSDPEYTESKLEFDRFELDCTRLGELAAEMTPEEFQHWTDVKLPALDDALENGVKSSTILKLLKAKVEKGLREGTEPTYLSVESLQFASAYLEHRLQQPETRLRHLNERYRDYTQILDRCQTRQEVIDASSYIRRDNARIGLTHNKAQGYSNERGALTPKELQILFTEQSPRHYTSEMIVAKLGYAGDGQTQNRRTAALLRGEISASPEAQRLIESLEYRMERRYAGESLNATKHFLQSLNTPNDELRFKNSFDHAEIYQKLPPPERDFVYQRATDQKIRLEAANRVVIDQRAGHPMVGVKELREVMKEELLTVSMANADPNEIRDRAAAVLERYLDKGEDGSRNPMIDGISRELSEVVLNLNRGTRPGEPNPLKSNPLEIVRPAAVARERAQIHMR